MLLFLILLFLVHGFFGWSAAIAFSVGYVGFYIIKPVVLMYILKRTYR